MSFKLERCPNCFAGVLSQPYRSEYEPSVISQTCNKCGYRTTKKSPKAKVLSIPKGGEK